MHLEKLPYNLTVCQVKDLSQIRFDEFLFLANTGNELSVVCRTDSVPENTIQREDGWEAFRISGTLAFSLVGILADIARCLADAGVSIFAVSTYDTDYILVKKADGKRAEVVLEEAGHTISAIVLP